MSRLIGRVVPWLAVVVAVGVFRDRYGDQQPWRTVFHVVNILVFVLVAGRIAQRMIASWLEHRRPPSPEGVVLGLDEHDRGT